MKLSKILCAVDNDPFADKVFDATLNLAKLANAEIGLVHVLDLRLLGLPEVGFNAASVQTTLDCDVRNFTERLLKRANGSKITLFKEEGDPAAVILRKASEWEPDLVILASHGRSGVTRTLLGSVAESVLRQSKCPVLILPRGIPL
jgi:nucleotide-binding universal stress UspA family protein